MRCWFVAIAVICSAFVSTNAAVIRGDITGKENGFPVSGATIEIGEKHLFTTSDRDGFFSFRSLPVGKYLLKITAIGFLPDSLFVMVKEDNPLVLHIVLQEKITLLNNIIVTDSIGPDSQFYGRMIEKKSIPLVSIISRQSIEQSSDITMADAMQRVSNVSLSADQTGALTKAIIRGMDAKYSYISVNGIALPSPDDRSRYVALDLFPANVIDRLEIYKTLTPEMPGDAIGGQMNIVTLQPPSSEQFSVRLATGYSQIFFQRPFLSFDSKVVQQKSPFDKYGAHYYAKGSDFTKDNLSFEQIHPLPDIQGDVSWGRKFFHQKLGIVAEAGTQNIKEGSNGFLIVQNSEPQLNNVPGITDFTKRQYSISSNRKNFYTQIDYHLNSHNNFRIDQLYTRKKDIEARDWVDTSLSEGRSGPGTGRIAFSQRSRLHYQSLYHLNVQGNHQISDEIFFDWAAIYSSAWGSYPDWAELTANTGRILGADGQIAQTPVLLAPLDRIWLHNTEKEKDISAKIGYTPKRFHQQLKLTGGTLLQYRNRANFYNEYIFNPAYTEPNGEPFSNIYNAVWYNDNGPQNPLGNTQTPGTYSAKENITAYFGEANIHLQKIDIIAGLRNEHTYQLVNSSVVPTDELGQQVKINYDDWLPSFHMRYALSKKENLRLSYYKAISRPALYDITFFNMDYDDYNVAGNPFLKRSTADNCDFRYELYAPRFLDELQLTAFYKQITNPYERTLLNAGDTLYPIASGGLSYTPVSKITEQLRNFATAHNYGFDISVVKHFGNMEISGNYTFTSSHITQSKKYKQRENPQDPSSDIITVTRLQQRPLQGQSRNVANINLSYRIPRFGWTAQLTGIYTGKRIEDISGWYNLDDWQKGYTLLNFSMEKTFHHHWRAFARISNLLNAGTTVYINEASVAGISEQTEKGKMLIEKTNNYGQYLVGIAYKL